MSLLKATKIETVCCSASSFSSTSLSPSVPFSLSFSPDLQMNGTLCADTVSRLPNEVSNYELCYFLCSTGCSRGKGRRTETKTRMGREKKEGMKRKQMIRDRNKTAESERERREQLHRCYAALNNINSAFGMIICLHYSTA